MDEKKITNISMDSILPNRMQPRVVFQDDAIDELAESILIASQTNVNLSNEISEGKKIFE